jgi:uncharacterized membrane protein (DUF373 family)
MLAPAALAIDMAGLIKGLIYLLIAALIVGVICYVIVRLATQFMPGFAPFAWILWVIGGLILLLVALNVFGPTLGL